MNTIEIDDTSETSESFTVDLIPATESIDGAAIGEIAGELVAADLTDEQEEIALEAIAISPEGLKLNAKAWRMRNWIAEQVAPQAEAIRHARAFLFRGLDERQFTPTVRGLHRAIAQASRD